MKPKFYFIPLLAVLFLLSACSASGTAEFPTAVSDPAVSDSDSMDEIMVEDQGADASGTSEGLAVPEPLEDVESTIKNEMTDASDEMADDGDGISDTMTGDEMSDSMDDDEITDSVSDDEMSDAMVGDEMSGEGMDEDDDSANAPAWQKSTLADARTGDLFTLSDFQGKTLFIEPMATWCGNCRRQLTNVRSAMQQLGGDDVIFIALSVETNIDDAALANYANGEGFDWRFAVMTPELLRLLADVFGQAITNPPATPHFIVKPDGTFTELVTGIESAEQIVTQIRAAQG